MSGPVDRFEAGGHEDELARIIDEVERDREEAFRATIGRRARAEAVAEMRREILRRFAEAHPGVDVRFLTGPHADPDAPRGQRGRTR